MIVDRRGFSLIEMLVVMTIMAILTTIGTLSFNQWSKKASIESQTRTLLSDLNSARLEAVTGKRRRGVVLDPGSYSLKSYSSADEKITTGGTVFSTTNLKYQIETLTGVFSGNHIAFDSRGFVENAYNPTIRAVPSYSGAAFDCIVVSVARNNIGKVEKVSGNDKCVPK
jgi:prepilin-type N-terminal cleavage/methylation domain-containing protein